MITSVEGQRQVQREHARHGGEVHRCCYVAMLWCDKARERYILEAIVCGAHLQTHCIAHRIIFVHEDMMENPAVWLLKLVWEVRPFKHLLTTKAMRASAHTKLQMVWSKLQIPELLQSEFQVVCVVDTDTMAVQSLDVVFQYSAPAAVFRGQKTSNLGNRRPKASYGTKTEGQRQIGGINGGFLTYCPSHSLFQAMMRKLQSYTVPSKGAEQDFLTDFFKDHYHDGITALPRSYNWQVHIAMLTGHIQAESSWWSQYVKTWRTSVKNWHFSADPKPVDMIWGSVRVSDNEPATPPWHRTTSSSSTFIDRAENPGPSNYSAAAPWRAHGYIDLLLTEMRENRQIRGVDVPHTENDPIRDMCHHAYQLWIDSLYDNVWPNIVHAVHKCIGDRCCSLHPMGNCARCGGEWELTGAYMQHNLFECMAADIYYHVQFDEERWATLKAHPFQLPHGKTAITEVMQYFGSVLKHVEQQTVDQAGHRWQQIQMTPRSDMLMAAGGEGETALLRWAREYKNQRRYAQRKNKRAKIR